MILLIPSIDLKEGVCCQKIHGQQKMDNFYSQLSDNPLELCKFLRKENSKSLHINDLDSFESGNNLVNINSMLYFINSVDIPIQVYSNYSSADECEMLLENGVYRVVIRDLQYREPNNIRELIKKYSKSRIVFGFKSENRKIKINDYDFVTDRDYIKFATELGADRFVIGEKIWDVKYDTANLEILSKLASDFNVRVTVFNGISTPEKLWALNEYKNKGIDSVIIGKPLFENNFPCQKIWRLIEAETEI